MNRNDLLQQWLREEAQPFEGWDFSYLKDRMFEDKAPWSYMDRAGELMQQATALIDVDTGGGERLLALRDRWPAKVVATEGYSPNFHLATERLAPLGVQVLLVQLSETSPLPLAAGEFDLILNRHGAINSEEFARILAPGGTFLTEGVHPLWAWDLMVVFHATTQWPHATPENYLHRLKAAGLTIEVLEDWQGKLRFTDVGAIVYYLKAIPWTVPGFSVRTHQAGLFTLQERVVAGEELAFTARTFLIEARKPKLHEKPDQQKVCVERLS